MDLKAWYAHKKVVLKCFNHHNGFMGNRAWAKWVVQTFLWAYMGDGQCGTCRSSTPKRLTLHPDNLVHLRHQIEQETVALCPVAKHRVFASPFGTGDARLEFESVGEDKSFQSQYSYFVEGLTDGWTPWQEEPVAMLTHLASGTYTIHIKSRTGGTGRPVTAKEAVIRFRPAGHGLGSPPYFPYYDWCY